MRICKNVKRAKARGKAIVSMMVLSGEKPNKIVSFVMTAPIAPCPIQPKARPAPVIANCVAERYFSRFSTICRASLAVGCPSFSFMASWDWRTFTSANSVATKKALKPMRSIVINSAVLGSGVIFTYCRTFPLFRKSRNGNSLCCDWTKFWMSDLSPEIPDVTKPNNKYEI